MAEVAVVEKRGYMKFITLAVSIVISNRLVKLTVLTLAAASLATLLILPTLTPLLLLSAVSLVASIVLHEFTHFVILDTDVVIINESGLIRIEAETDGVRAITSALAGPLAPFFTGMAIWHYDPLPAIPFLAHVATLPFDILGALGVKICEKQC